RPWLRPSGCVHQVRLDQQVVRVRAHGRPPARVVGAGMPDVVNVVHHDLRVVRATARVVGIDPVTAGPPDLEPLDPDVTPLDLDACKRGIVSTVDHGAPLVLGLEDDEVPRRPAPGQVEHNGPAGVEPVAYDD